MDDFEIQDVSSTCVDKKHCNGWHCKNKQRVNVINNGKDNIRASTNDMDVDEDNVYAGTDDVAAQMDGAVGDVDDEDREIDDGDCNGYDCLFYGTSPSKPGTLAGTLFRSSTAAYITEPTSRQLQVAYLGISTASRNFGRHRLCFHMLPEALPILPEARSFLPEPIRKLHGLRDTDIMGPTPHPC